MPWNGFSLTPDPRFLTPDLGYLHMTLHSPLDPQNPRNTPLKRWVKIVKGVLPNPPPGVLLNLVIGVNSLSVLC